MTATEEQLALVEAFKRRDLEEFGRLLDSGGVDPSYRYGKPYFGTCLELACMASDRASGFVEKLLAAGASPNVNVVIPEPIHYAARSGNAAALKALLAERKTRVNAVDSGGRTALHWAVLRLQDDTPAELAARLEESIRLLARCPRFDVDRADAQGFSPLHLAAHKGHGRAARAVLAECRAALRPPLNIDRLAGGRTVRQALETVVPNVSAELPVTTSAAPGDKLRLLLALKEGDLALYKRLLRRAALQDGFDVDFWFDEPYDTRLLESACCLSQPNLAADFVAATLEAGANPCAINLCSRRTPMHVAAEMGNATALELLLQHPKADGNLKDNNGQAPIHLAAHCTPGADEHECLKVLLPLQTIAVDEPDASGMTPADIAGCDLARKLLERRGASVKTKLRTARSLPILDIFDSVARDDFSEFENRLDSINLEDISGCEKYGCTLLQYACERGRHNFARKLLEKVNPNATHTKNKRTPLMIACMKGDKDMVKLLLDTKTVKQIAVNAVDPNKDTALHFAAKTGDLDIILKLLNHGAEVGCKNKFGKYPFSVQELESVLDKCLYPQQQILPSNEEFVITFNYNILISQVICIQEQPDIFLEQGEKARLNSELCTHYSEMQFLESLSSLPGYQELFKHPLIGSYLNIKNNSMKWLLHLNLIICTIFVFSLNMYILIEVSKPSQRLLQVAFIQPYLQVAGHITTILLGGWEVLQLILKPKQYLKNFENIFDILLIFMALLVLCEIPISIFFYWACTGAVLLSWWSFFVITGQYPKFSKNVEMLKVVSHNYLNLFKSYIFVVFAFSISFYVIFSPLANQNMNASQVNLVETLQNTSANLANATADSDSGMGDFFDNPLKTLFKTAVMMTGEFELGDLPFRSDIWLGTCVFILFMFFLPVVLMNLLTALAVSDEQQIRSNAEILSLVSQIKCLSQIENVVSSLQKLLKKCCGENFARKMEHIWLFPQKSADEACLLLWPNKGPNVRLSGEMGKCVKTLESSIIEEAKNLVMKLHFQCEDCIDEKSTLTVMLKRIESLENNLLKFKKM